MGKLPGMLERRQFQVFKGAQNESVRPGARLEDAAEALQVPALHAPQVAQGRGRLASAGTLMTECPQGDVSFRGTSPLLN